MTAKAINDLLKSRDWIIEGEPEGHVPVAATGLFKCVDGRRSARAEMNGPKALGGLYAIASDRGVRHADGLQEIVNEVREKGYVPSVHGDSHAGPMGCGYFKLWKTGRLPGVRPPNFDADEGRAAVLAAGGVYEDLAGSHQEWYTIINLREGTTFEPRPTDQRFVVDAWIQSVFGLSDRYLLLAAATVEALRPAAMRVRILPAS